MSAGIDAVVTCGGDEERGWEAGRSLSTRAALRRCALRMAEVVGGCRGFGGDACDSAKSCCSADSLPELSARGLADMSTVTCAVLVEGRSEAEGVDLAY